ncbi:MAG: kelch repeat-containing protein [Bacteroidota bacterium]|nr:kelch repeat-containing protein [Bacteroidota bacterium]
MKKLFTLFLLINSAAFFGQWTASTVIPANRTQHGLVAHPNGNVYLFSGYAGTSIEVNTMFVFNIATNTWTTGPNVPYTARGVAYCLGTDNMVYCVGGYPPTTAFARFNPATNTWTTLASCPTGNWEGSCVSVNNKIYYAGGETVESLMRIYDIATDTWSTGANLPTGLKLHKMVSGNDGNLYVFGGHTSAATPTNIVQRYNIAANTWSVVGTMPVQKNQYGACLAPDGRIYIVCGKNNGGNNSGPFFNDVNIFNPCNNSWTVGFAHPTAHGELAVTSTSNGIFAMGGTSGTGLNINYFLPVTPSSLTYPNIVFSQPTVQVCAGSSATINVTGASTYTWSTGSNSSSIVITPTANTTYSVIGTSSAGCVSQTTAVNNVTLNALPTLSIVTSNSLICTGNSATLTASGATTFTWNTAANGANIAVTPSVTTSYTVNGTDGNGCTNMTTITQSVSLCTEIAVNSLKENLGVSIFPNPNNGNLNINFASLAENVTIELYNGIGQLIISKKATSLNSNLNFESAANGIYTLRITENGKNVFNSKVVKN